VQVAAPLVELVWSQTKGNPLFVEELTHMLNKSGCLVQTDRKGPTFEVSLSSAPIVLPGQASGALAVCPAKESDGASEREWSLAREALELLDPMPVPLSLKPLFVQQVDRLPHAAALLFRLQSVFGMSCRKRHLAQLYQSEGGLGALEDALDRCL
jgi:hypothetical protein